jgi:hypothetical protein
MATFLFLDGDLFFRTPTGEGAEYRWVHCDVVVPPQPPVQPALWLAAMGVAMGVAVLCLLLP